MLTKICKVFLMMLIISSSVSAQKIIKNDKLYGNLEVKFTSVFNSEKSSDNFWVGYSIDRTDGKMISAGSFFVSDELTTGFGDLVEGKISYKQYSNLSSRKHGVNIYGHSIQISDKADSEIEKETAILFRYDRSSEGINDIAEIAICNFSHSVDLEGYSLYWLGESSTKMSAEFAMDLYNSSSNIYVKKELVAAIGANNDQPGVTTFLKNIFYNSTNEDFKEDVIFWIGLQNNEQAFQILKDIIKNESSELGEQAVFAMTNIDTEEALNEIIRLAKSSHDRNIREHAVYALGNKAVKKAEFALKGFIEEDPDIEIKKAALYSLANDGENQIDYLIDMAKNHPSLTLRKAAIYSLSNIESPKAVNTLIEMAEEGRQ